MVGKLPSSLTYSTCEKEVHPFYPSSCTKAFLIVWKDTFLFSLKIYGPLFFLPPIFLRKKGFIESLKNNVVPILRSSVFLATIGATTLPISCFIRYLTGKFSGFTIFLAGFITGFFSIFIENPSRREELIVYNLNQSIEALYKSLSNEGFLPQIKYGSTLIFIFAMSISKFVHEINPNNLGIASGIIEFISPKPKDLPIDNNYSYSLISFLFLKNTLRAFGLGFIGRFLLVIINSLFFQRRKNSSSSEQPPQSKQVKIREILIHKLFSIPTLRFASFLALFGGFWNSLPLLLFKWRKKKDNLNSLLSGAISGISFSLFSEVEISMFFASKALHGLFKLGVEKNFIKPIKYADIILFALCSGFIFFCTVLEPYNLRKSYYTFLNAAASGRYNQFEEVTKAWNQRAFEKSGFKFPQKK